jgi:predicted phosphate transport protein (TIGR00153 family)
LNADAIIRWFMPKEERFHVLFSEDTRNLVAAADLFTQIAHSSSLAEREALGARLKQLEHNGDRITRSIFDALNSTFITPFDREDIRSLTTDLDDILDYLEGMAHSLVLFDLEESTDGLRKFAEIVSSMVKEIDRLTALIWDLGNEPQIRESTVKISDLENEADRLYNQVIADLFRGNGRNPIEILKWKEIYEGLENACDQCKNYTHVIGNIVVKNS